MLEFIKKNLKVLLVLLLIPIIFIGILEYFSEEITVDGWLGFLGGYFGILGAVGAVQYQAYLEESKNYNNLISYVNYVSRRLIPIFEKKALMVVRYYLPFSEIKFHDIQKFDDESFDIIDTEIIKNYLSLIVADKDISDILKLKESIKKIENCIEYLGENYIDRKKFLDFGVKLKLRTPLYSKKGDFSNFYFSLDTILFILCRNISDSYFEKIILNKEFSISSIQFDKEKIEECYHPLMDNLIKKCQNSNIGFLDLLYCYINWLSEFTNLLYFLNFSENTETNNKFYKYFSTCLELAFAIEDSYKILLNLKREEEKFKEQYNKKI